MCFSQSQFAELKSSKPACEAHRHLDIKVVVKDYFAAIAKFTRFFLTRIIFPHFIEKQKTAVLPLNTDGFHAIRRADRQCREQRDTRAQCTQPQSTLAQKSAANLQQWPRNILLERKIPREFHWHRSSSCPPLMIWKKNIRKTEGLT